MSSRAVLAPGADLDGFRRAVRALVAADTRPDAVTWTIGDAPGLFGATVVEDAPPVSLPKAVGTLVGDVVPHRDPERYALLYEVIWRVTHGERSLLKVGSDPTVHRLELMRKSVGRDIHKMHAFLRFRRAEPGSGAQARHAEVPGEAGPRSTHPDALWSPPSRPASRAPQDEGVNGTSERSALPMMESAAERFVAWFESEHFILEAVAPFFVDRFRAMRWTILTPIGAIDWDGEAVRFGPPGDRRDAPDGDTFEAGWKGYYESTFNPARTNEKLMRSHMPQKYWHNLPEAASIPNLVRSASARVDVMLREEPTVPTKREPQGALAAMLDQTPASLDELNRIIKAAGPLVPGATQAVVGEGPPNAGIVFVGEQPGDEEDLKGRPFVGPAGRLLDRAMEEAGITRRDVYLTNAVKHFKFEQRGKRRIHQKPTAGEVSHYRWWLMRELELIEPKLVVALGGTAVLALTGKSLPITRSRGPATLLEEFPGFITVHPSYLLRIPEEDAKAEAYRSFVGDLRQVRQLGEATRASATLV